ncbi:hypothetical protein C8F04DRAFT_714729 [Mycena alexandri]|uniref:Uncharacterized protein n=1 Tax=Mycena alexandri TaxID=1745969 RepID=A0AAD6WZD1_9AGAR|nr:hypothetical protein C8F04DRAFT_714729 [Mycena alexandri]
MSTALPDEIISEILSPALKVSDERFSDTSDVSPFAKYELSTSAYLVVCKDWLRVATPLLYNVIVLRSRSQANALEKVLQKHKDFGRFIRKLRVEGGYGMAMHTILKSAPNITDIFLTLKIWSEDSTQGLCKGLPLINPHRVILVDPRERKARKNQNLTALTTVLLRCIREWDNMRVFDFPYLCHYRDPAWMARAIKLVEALRHSKGVHTILLAQFFETPPFLRLLSEITTVQTLQFKVGPVYIKTAIESDPRLKALVRYPPEPTEIPPIPVYIADIAPSLNPFFIPMASASEDTRDRVWNRVFSFAMYQPTSAPRVSESRNAQLAILLVSKYFNRLALPYLYEYPNLTSKGAELMAAQLLNRPELGSFIKILSMPYVATEVQLHLLSLATNLREFQGIQSQQLPPQHFKVLGLTAGLHLWRTSFNFARGDVPASLFAHFTELRELTLWTSGVQFIPDTASNIVLNKLHTLRVESPYRDTSFLHAFSMIKLPALRILRMNFFTVDADRIVGFFNAHGGTLSHLSFKFYHQLPPNFKLFDVCPDLVEVEFFENLYADGTTLTRETLSCVTPHKSLAKMIMFDDIIADPDDLDPAKFPALQEIQIQACKWPTTEREISKSDWVRLAEAWLKLGIKLTDSDGQHWVPRVKRARGR